MSKLELPVPWRIQSLLPMLSDHLGKAVVLELIPAVGGVAGFTTSTPQRVVIALRTPPSGDIEQIDVLDLGHELGHILLGHDACQDTDSLNERAADEFSHLFYARHERIVEHGLSMSTRQAMIVRRYVKYLEGR